MNVYRVRTTCETNPKSGDPRQIYASVDVSRLKGLDMVEYFDGKPYPKKWRAVKLSLAKPRLKRPDFLNFNWKVLVCNERAMEVVGELLRDAGEVFPVTVAGEKEKFFLSNVTQMLGKALNPAESEYRVSSYKRLTKPAFHAAKIPADVKLFKLPQQFGLQIYCVERTGDPEDGEFKALVDQHGLIGLTFELMWTDGRPAAGKAKSQPVKRRPPRAARSRAG